MKIKILFTLGMFFFLVGCGPKVTDDPIIEETPVYTSSVTSNVVIKQVDSFDFDSFVFIQKDGANITFNPSWIVGTYDTTVIGTYPLSLVYSNTEDDISINKSFNLIVVPSYTFTNFGTSITIEFGSTINWDNYILIKDYTNNVVSIDTDWIDCDASFNVLGDVSCVISYSSNGIEVFSETYNIEVVDTQQPVINYISDIYYTIGDTLPVLTGYFTASDNYDGDISSSISLDFNDLNLTVPGTYYIIASVTDSSNNSEVIYIPYIVTLSDDNNLSAKALEILAGLVNFFSVSPDPIGLQEIGELNTPILDISTLTNTRAMFDLEILNIINMNTVTAPEYFEIINTYNGSLSNIQSYLAVILPLAAAITEYDVEYSFGGFTFVMTKVNEEQYVISVSGSMYGQAIELEIVVDELAIFGDFMYSIQFTTPIASWHYEITRGLLGVKSITEITEFLGDSYGIVYMNVFVFDDGVLSGFIFKDELTVTRRMYFEFTDVSNSIYYLNDDTGTEKYISLDLDGKLVFEYEDYQPRINPLGTSKARWALDAFSGYSTIAFDDGFFGNDYTVDSVFEYSESDAFRIEAKEYIQVVYDNVNEVYNEVVLANWFFRVEGTWAADKADLFDLPYFFAKEYAYDVESTLADLETNKDEFTVFDLSFTNITKQDILDYLSE